MAYNDDLLNAAQKRTRTGRSFFPAANYGNGQVIQGSSAGNYEYRALPPDQNPAYQAAISGGRPARSGYTTITLPSGGTASVPIASQQRYLDAFPERPAIAASGGAPAVGVQRAATPYDPNYARDITHVQNALNFPQIYNQGYANIPAVSAPLNPQERVQRGQSGFGEIASVAARNINRGLSSWFNTPAATQYANNVSTGQVPSQPATAQQPVQSQNYYNYNPSPAPPRRYSDLGYY